MLCFILWIISNCQTVSATSKSTLTIFTEIGGDISNSRNNYEIVSKKKRKSGKKRAKTLPTVEQKTSDNLENYTTDLVTLLNIENNENSTGLFSFVFIVGGKNRLNWNEN